MSGDVVLARGHYIPGAVLATGLIAGTVPDRGNPPVLVPAHPPDAPLGSSADCVGTAGICTIGCIPLARDVGEEGF